ncbi:hypothetical protein Ahy_B05g076554 [Arachis hypogaea]|uniref:Uncharacterized protein n=1 Tax=Arachis hypogaea TaxID=3818 RepID=A0A444Z3F7_ARAHY|nr:hypothetical protein Ahy_B05g076554 [Arachis hypogaea]
MKTCALLRGVIFRRDCVLSQATISSSRFSSGGAFTSSYNLCKLHKTTRSIAQVFPPMIFFGSDLLHQHFSSIDEICCVSVSYGVELCSAISPSPSSFIKHLEEIGGEAFTKFSSNFICIYLFEHLKKYLGTKHELDGGFTRSLIHRTEDKSKASSRGMINIIISVSKMELADKVAAARFLVVVPDLLYGDYFSYDPQFDREGWLKKHGETRERFLSLRKGIKSEVANALEEVSFCISYLFGTAYVHTQHSSIQFFELLNDWIEKITSVIASLLSSQIPEKLLPASPMGSAHNRQKLGVKISTLEANNQDKRRIGVRTEIIITKYTKSYNGDFMY